MRRPASIILILLGITIAGNAWADCPPNSLLNPLNPTCDPSGCNTVLCPMQVVVNVIFAVAIPLTTIMALYGGFLMITSTGDPEKVAHAKRTLLWAAVGFAVVVLSGGASALIKNII